MLLHMKFSMSRNIHIRSVASTSMKRTVNTASQPSSFLSREMGLIAFNQRVLAQAADGAVPLLERLRFLCIVSSNLDELFEVRVAELKERVKAGNEPAHPGDQAPADTLRELSAAAHALVDTQYQLLNSVILPRLAEHGIRFLARNDWSAPQQFWLHDYFEREMMPVLTPIGLDPAHPFPRVLNKSLNFAIQLDGRDAFGRDAGIAIVQAPRLLPRIIELPAEISSEGKHFVLLTSVLEAFVGELFEDMTVTAAWPWRVTRNSDLWLDEEEIKDLRIALQGELPQRHFGDSVRLEVREGCPVEVVDFLLRQFDLEVQDLYAVKGPVNLVRLMPLPDMVDAGALKYQPFTPGLPRALERSSDLLVAIRQQDILLHHPFQSFNPVLELLEEAASDPDVVAIKQTVYRTGTDSLLMKYLIDAARRGKEVTVVVELMARFDEEANLNWAARLEEVGAHVVYGVFGYKTHAKMLMLVRREHGRLRRYVHLSTGNYHPRTARLYTDWGMFTAHEGICADVNEVFRQLTGFGSTKPLRHLWLSPFNMHQRLIEAIGHEARLARSGKRAQIIAKMNALVEPGVIAALYAASAAGVRIELIVRGVCALRPGVKGLSENIRVISVVGRFLEHSRIWYFHDDGAQSLYLSSADWMDRNLFRRVEIGFPVLDSKLKARVLKEGLRPYLTDDSQAWLMDADGNYQRRRSRNKLGKCAQQSLLQTLGLANGQTSSGKQRKTK
jgi:polyphosphate kinase